MKTKNVETVELEKKVLTLLKSDWYSVYDLMMKLYGSFDIKHYNQIRNVIMRNKKILDEKLVAGVKTKKIMFRVK